MTQKQTKPVNSVYKNPLEALDIKAINNAPINKRTALFEQAQAQVEAQQSFVEKQDSKASLKNEFSLYSKDLYFEQKKRYEVIEQLSTQIRQEIKLIKAKSSEFAGQVDAIEKHTLQSPPEKPGVYHIRYLELLLQFLRGLREKVAESNTWMAAMQSKKKKRGSLFVVNAKKKGTQYFMSQELSVSRSVG